MELWGKAYTLLHDPSLPYMLFLRQYHYHSNLTVLHIMCTVYTGTVFTVFTVLGSFSVFRYLTAGSGLGVVRKIIRHPLFKTKRPFIYLHIYMHLLASQLSGIIPVSLSGRYGILIR